MSLIVAENIQKYYQVGEIGVTIKTLYCMPNLESLR